MFIPYGSGIIIFYRAKKLSHRQVRRIDSGTALKKKTQTKSRRCILYKIYSGLSNKMYKNIKHQQTEI